MITYQTHTMISELATMPNDIDKIIVEIGENPNEPELVIKAVKNGQVTFFLDFELFSGRNLNANG